MAIRTLFTKGYGNGTFSGTIALVVLKGYAATGLWPGEAPVGGSWGEESGASGAWS